MRRFMKIDKISCVERMSKQNNHHIDNSVFSYKGNLYTVHENVNISFYNIFWNVNSSIIKSPKQTKNLF